MMGQQTVRQDALFYGFSLADHVPADHLLRLIDRFIELSSIRRHLAPYYSTLGRPSIDLSSLIAPSFSFAAARASRGVRFEDEVMRDHHAAHRIALLVQQHAAGSDQQRVPAGVVVSDRAVQRNRRDPVAGRNPRQAVGDAGQGHEARRLHKRAIAERIEMRALIQEDDRALRQRRRREIVAHRMAVAQQMIHALGPGDEVRGAVRRHRRMHDAKHRRAIPKQGHRNRAAAMAAQEVRGAVMRIDRAGFRVL